mmetsp:Transcript_886/g.2236  ORF Transcript_886/g.2236 Transcript_886/m.2236 type:complete len:159 (+) Transcript_886:70-546(+)
MQTMLLLLTMSFLPGGALGAGCSWGAQNIQIAPYLGYSFCCPGMSGSATFPASATYKSVNDDNYSLRPGLSQQQVAKSCENSIDAWSKEEFHNDNFEHTTSTTFSPSNFKTETAAMVFWCHNLLTPCQLSLTSVNIGTKGITNATVTNSAAAPTAALL